MGTGIKMIKWNWLRNGELACTKTLIDHINNRGKIKIELGDKSSYQVENGILQLNIVETGTDRNMFENVVKLVVKICSIDTNIGKDSNKLFAIAILVKQLLMDGLAKYYVEEFIKETELGDSIKQNEVSNILNKTRAYIGAMAVEFEKPSEKKRIDESRITTVEIQKIAGYKIGYNKKNIKIDESKPEYMVIARLAEGTCTNSYIVMGRNGLHEELWGEELYDLCKKGKIYNCKGIKRSDGSITFVGTKGYSLKSMTIQLNYESIDRHMTTASDSMIERRLTEVKKYLMTQKQFVEDLRKLK